MVPRDRWTHVNSAVIAPEGVAAGREDFRAVVLMARLAEAVRLNPKLPEVAVEVVVHIVTKPEYPSLAKNVGLVPKQAEALNEEWTAR